MPFGAGSFRSSPSFISHEQQGSEFNQPSFVNVEESRSRDCRVAELVEQPVSLSTYEFHHLTHQREIVRPPVSPLRAIIKAAGRLCSGDLRPEHARIAILDSIYEPPAYEAQDTLRHYLDTSRPMARQEQLEATASFWNTCGLTQAEPPDMQRYSLDAAVEAHPAWRIVPTPVLNSYGRVSLALTAKYHFKHQQLDKGSPALALPGEPPFDSLLYKLPDQYANGLPAAEVLDDDTIEELEVQADERLVIGGRLPRTTIPGEHRPVTRNRLISWLYRQDRLRFARQLEGSQLDTGLFWAFPVVSVDTAVPETPLTAGELHDISSPYVLPETLLAVGLMHQLAGDTRGDQTAVVQRPSQTVFGNEAIYGVRPGERPVLRFVVGVGSTALTGGLAHSLQIWHPDRHDPSFRVRPAVNETMTRLWLRDDADDWDDPTRRYFL